MSGCHEGVTKDDEFQPCDKPAVATRYDEDGSTYPVCVKHTRKPMVPLAQHDAEVAGKALLDAAEAIKADFADPGRRRPRKSDAQFATDLVTDPEWCAQIVLAATTTETQR